MGSTSDEAPGDVSEPTEAYLTRVSERTNERATEDSVHTLYCL